MARQLALLEEPARSWRLDEATRERGKAGVAAARGALRRPRRATPEGGDRHGRRTLSRGAA